jgi:hypothetical protein
MLSDKPNKKTTLNLFERFKKWIKNRGKKETNVYFISGMCYNCSVFDKLTLPKGFSKQYIEWPIPDPEVSLRDYALLMSKQIDTSRPFILVGYSFGAVIIQEMSHFLKPEKSIIISSFKSEEEIPLLFKAVRKAHLADKVPMKVFSATEFITNAFNYLVYNMSNTELAQFMTCTDPVYIRWAVRQITDWVPDNKCRSLYHIHGTEDQVFPYDRLKNVFPVQGGDHLMVQKKARTVSSILGSILLIKEDE